MKQIKFDGTIKQAKKICMWINSFLATGEDAEAMFSTYSDDDTYVLSLQIWDCNEGCYAMVMLGKTIVKTGTNDFYIKYDGATTERELSSIAKEIMHVVDAVERMEGQKRIDFIREMKDHLGIDWYEKAYV